jgi:hypothetical protein
MYRVRAPGGKVGYLHWYRGRGVTCRGQFIDFTSWGDAVQLAVAEVREVPE